MMVGCSALMWVSRRLGQIRSFALLTAISITSGTTLRARQGSVSWLLTSSFFAQNRGKFPMPAPTQARSIDTTDREQNTPLAPSQRHEIRFSPVMSASVKPRLAGRQPSNRGGVPRVIDQVE